MNLHTIQINYIENLTNTGRQAHHFNVRDSKGRVLGASVALYEGDRTINDKQVYIDVKQDDLKPAGRVHGFCPQATRDGVAFGACKAVQWFDSSKQRDDAAARYFANAQKRAQKNAA